jgi:hypothetical protein
LVFSLLILFLGHHDPEFSRHIDFLYSANTLNNAERHLRDYHFLDVGGDIWRLQRDSDELPAQPSGIIEGSYEKAIPFRQLEFKNAFLEWMILDNIKHRKAASVRLKRMFKIANLQAAEALPENHGTVARWVHDMFNYFEPEIIKEIQNAKSRISISFDGWVSKREKISVLGVVAHFINDKYEAVTRLIGLPELPGHGKTGAGKLFFLYY